MQKAESINHAILKNDLPFVVTAIRFPREVQEALRAIQMDLHLQKILGGIRTYFDGEENLYAFIVEFKKEGEN